jgi:(2S)-methylsuccinyl-CoA dehydrogenase
MMLSSREPGHDLGTMAESAVDAMEGLLADAIAKVRGRVAVEGRIIDRLFDREQRAAHGLAWLATYVEAIRQLSAYAERLSMDGHLSEIEELVIRIGFGEYLAQIFGGIPMSQSEIVRLADLGLTRHDVSTRMTASVEALIASGNTAQRRARLVELIRLQHDSTPGTRGLDDTLEAIRDEMRKFAVSEVTQQAQRWHLSNSYIPLDVVAHLADHGVFGLTIPEEFGGMGLGRLAMCVVSEELSRGYIGVGSLNTRTEIAADLILHHGTEAQKRKWLPGLAVGEVLPAVAFSEPASGSDLASIRTRAVREGEVYKLRGSKAWVTHAARADLLLVLARTNPRENGYRGLSILLTEKTRGSAEKPFPEAGMVGSETVVTGYRGMKQFELTFDGFEVPVSALLGSVEGAGFKQAMQTFETARIQTAARGVGVAQSALDQAIGYSAQRQQFGMPIIAFPRVADKIAMMATEIAIARQLTYFAARKKDAGGRCDVEAAMAKLLAARVAWAAADSSVQVHGGNGVAVKSSISRILADARVLSILEGSAEILTQVIARRLLVGLN